MKLTAPFGIEFGVNIENLNILSELDEGKYVVDPPSKHPMFSTYVVQATPKHGVVWLKALSDEIPNDSFGTATSAAVDKIAGQLANKYGTGKKTNILFHGALWDSPEYWMNSLEANERQYNFVWEKPRSSGLPGDLSTIFVSAIAFNSFEGGVIIEYASSKFEEAAEEFDKSQSDFL